MALYQAPPPVRYPNEVQASDPVSSNSGDGGRVLAPRLITGPDLGQMARDGSKVYNRGVADIIRDHGRSISWYIDSKNPYENTQAFKNACLNEDVVVIDRSSIYLSNVIGDDGELNNVHIVSLLGDRPVTIYQTVNTRRIFTFSNTKRVRFTGKFRLAYLKPAGSATKALEFDTCSDVYMDNVVVEGAGIGAYFNAVDNIRFGSLRVTSPAGDGVVLNDGKRLAFDAHLTVTGGAARGISVASGWDGMWQANRVTATGCQTQGIEYASGGKLDQITDLRISNNGLSSSGNLAGLLVDATARNLKVLGGEIGQDADGSGVTQKYGVDVVALADYIYIGANLLGNTTPYRNGSAANVTFAGF